MKRHFVIAGTLLGVVLAIGLFCFVNATISQRTGEVHSFELNKVPSFLTDEIALTKCREALSLEGLDSSEWEPKKQQRTTDPEDNPDTYLVRNAINPNQGHIFFINKNLPKARFVSVELHGSRVTCQVTKPK